MSIHTRKLPTFALYTAYTDDLGVVAFGNYRDEVLNNLAEEVKSRAFCKFILPASMSRHFAFVSKACPSFTPR